MMALSGKNIVLGVTGGIAAYKAADLTRRLKDAGAEVRVVMTQAAQEFVTPLTFQALSGNPVRSELFDPEAEAAMGHIELARWADLVLIAPATADFIARLTHGRADDLLTTLCLATEAPIALAPAMNRAMWSNPATQDNQRLLQRRGTHMLGPDTGSQACGETGEGRMLEPSELIERLNTLFNNGLLTGLRVLMTVGPTREALDPVRFLTNRSSGKMGFALAASAVEMGAHVTVICGPVALTTAAGVQRVDVETAEEMQAAVMQRVADCNVFIGAAAVADYRPATRAGQKIKKTQDELHLTLLRNPDILVSVASLPNRPFTVGFAAETERLIEQARQKLIAKKLDMIAANPVGRELGFESDENTLEVLWPGGQVSLPRASKNKLARDLLKLIANRYHSVRTQDTDGKQHASNPS